MGVELCGCAPGFSEVGDVGREASHRPGRVAKVFKLGEEKKEKREPMDHKYGAIPKSTESSESRVAGRKLEFTGIRAIIALVSGGGGINASGNRRIEFQLKLGF